MNQSIYGCISELLVDVSCVSGNKQLNEVECQILCCVWGYYLYWLCKNKNVFYKDIKLVLRAVMCLKYLTLFNIIIGPKSLKSTITCVTNLKSSQN
jgi:hypothetical protein